MSYTISPKTREHTYCPYDFYCLSGNLEKICKPLNSDWAKIVITNCPERAAQCDYCRPFKGDEGICICPTRLELYGRYGV
jgi:hypothetical protein